MDWWAKLPVPPGQPEAEAGLGKNPQNQMPETVAIVVPRRFASDFAWYTPGETAAALICILSVIGQQRSGLPSRHNSQDSEPPLGQQTGISRCSRLFTFHFKERLHAHFRAESIMPIHRFSRFRHRWPLRCDGQAGQCALRPVHRGTQSAPDAVALRFNF